MKSININSRSDNHQEKILSALANRPFKVGEQMFSSVEGFYHGIRFKPDDKRRFRAFASSYGYAQNFREIAQNDFVYWDNKVIDVGSLEHKEIIELAFRQSFLQNPDRMKALLDTRGYEITHNIGEKDPPNSPFTQKEFCILHEKLRDEFIEQQNL